MGIFTLIENYSALPVLMVIQRPQGAPHIPVNEYFKPDLLLESSMEYASEVTKIVHQYLSI